MSKHSAIRRHPLILFSNHMDAWGVTFIIVSTFLLIHETFDARSLSLLVCMTVGYWFGFALNDYFDVDVDANTLEKAKNNFFVQFAISEHIAGIAAFVIVGGLFAGFLQFAWQGILVFALAIFIAWAYSSPPLRLKSRPILDLICHAVFVQTFPYLVCLILIDVPLLTIDYWLLAFFFCSSLSAQLEQQARDYALDKLHDNNFTVQFGKPLSLLLQKIATLILLLIGVLSLWFDVLPPKLVPIGLLGLPLLFHRFLRRNDAPRSERLIKVSVMLVLAYVVALWIASILS